MQPLFMLLLPACILFDSGVIVIQEDADSIASSIRLNSPIDGAQYIANTPILFEAEIVDQKINLDELDIAWYSSIDGPLDIEMLAALNTYSGVYSLSEGQHTIHLVVSDPKGNHQNAKVEISTIDESGSLPPECQRNCQLNPPPQDTTYSQSETIVIEGEVSTELDLSDLTATLSSDQDGPLGEAVINPDGRFVLDVQLQSQGTHTVTLDVNRNGEFICSSSAEFVIEDQLGAEILQPSDGQILTLSDQILFSGKVPNADLASGEITVSWFSSLDTYLYNGSPDNQGQSLYSPTDLTFGVHNLSFVVFENDIEITSDSIEFTFNGRPIIDDVSIFPVDAQTNEPVTCSANAYDEDGGQLEISFEFSNLNTGDIYQTIFENETDAIVDLSQTNIQAGQRLQCEVTVTDALGFDTSSATNIIVGDTSVPQEPANK